MITPRYTWFQKFIASVWIFGAMFLYLGVSTANMMTLRDVDASLGILSRPSNSFLAKAGDAFFGSPKVNAIPVEITFDPYKIAESALNAAIRSAISGFINQIISIVADLFNDLINSLEDMVKTVTGLRLNLGSVRATIALKAVAYENKVNKNKEINKFLDKYFPTEDSLRVNMKQAMETYGMGLALAASDTNDGRSNLDNSFYTSVNKNNEVISTVAGLNISSVCGDSPITPVAGYLSACKTEELVNINTVKTDLAFFEKSVHDNVKDSIALVESEQPKECPVSIISLGGQLSPSSDINNLLLPPDSVDFSTNNYTANLDIFAASVTVAPLTQTECQASNAVFSTSVDAAKEANKKDSPSLEGSIVSSLSDLIKSTITNIFSKLKDMVLKVFNSAANQVIGKLPNFFKSFAYTVSGGVNQYLNAIKIKVNTCRDNSVKC